MLEAGGGAARGSAHPYHWRDHQVSRRPPPAPVKAFGIDRVYRREAIDTTHTPEFEQLEGIVMDET